MAQSNTYCTNKTALKNIIFVSYFILFYFFHSSIASATMDIRDFSVGVTVGWSTLVCDERIRLLKFVSIKELVTPTDAWPHNTLVTEAITTEPHQAQLLFWYNIVNCNKLKTMKINWSPIILVHRTIVSEILLTFFIIFYDYNAYKLYEDGYQIYLTIFKPNNR